MKNIIYLCLSIAALSFIFVSCGEDEGKAPGEYAEEYYAALIEGNYDAFVDGMYSAGHISRNYRSEKVVLMKYFVAEQAEKHGGIHSAVASRDTVYPDGVHADAFLSLTYGNDSTEEVVVQMV